eukprot:scaffold132019_cov34-Tisochrysis_lutea.AAC.2
MKGAQGIDRLRVESSLARPGIDKWRCHKLSGDLRSQKAAGCRAFGSKGARWELGVASGRNWHHHGADGRVVQEPRDEEGGKQQPEERGEPGSRPAEQDARDVLESSRDLHPFGDCAHHSDRHYPLGGETGERLLQTDDARPHEHEHTLEQRLFGRSIEKSHLEERESNGARGDCRLARQPEEERREREKDEGRAGERRAIHAA